MRKRTISRTILEPIDEWLENLQLFRKHIPRDGSCLFRAVAEQVCLSQSYHEQLRNLALDYMLLYKSIFQQHLSEPLELHVKKMRSPHEWGDKLELMALSLIFKIDFLLFTEVRTPAVNITGHDFPRKIMLYKDQGTHYDIVYTKRHTVVAGFCQALVYEILYSKVFKMADVMNVVDQMLHDNNSCFRKDSTNSEGQEMDIIRIVEQVTDSSSKASENVLNQNLECFSTPEKGLTPPFPYRVAKALDPDVYRNSEYDAWIALRREARFGPYDSKGLQIGVKVIIRTCLLIGGVRQSPQRDQIYHGHIQSMTENQGPVEVFAEELGKRITVPYHCLEKVPVPLTPPSLHDRSMFSPPTYKVLSTITRKTLLPIPDSYNSPGHGKGKRKNWYPLPSAIQSSRQKNSLRETFHGGKSNSLYEPGSPGFGTPVPVLKEEPISEESLTPPEAADMHTATRVEYYPSVFQALPLSPDYDFLAEPFAGMNLEEANPHLPPTPLTPVAMQAGSCEEAGCNGQCSAGVVFPGVPMAEMMGVPAEPLPYTAFSYLVPYHFSPYYYSPPHSDSPLGDGFHPMAAAPYVPVYTTLNTSNEEVAEPFQVSALCPADGACLYCLSANPS